MFRIKSGGVDERDCVDVLADKEEYCDSVCRNVVLMTDAELLPTDMQLYDADDWRECDVATAPAAA